jgi:hypothetical protein
MAALKGWVGAQWGCLRTLGFGESGWRHWAHNRSGATGIPQALPGSKLYSAIRHGWERITQPVVQVRWFLTYVAGRYGTPCRALGAWYSRSPHWY